MKGPITPYLTFYGQAREAAQFYARVFGMEIVEMNTYGESNFPTPPNADDLIIHGHLKKGPMEFMVADSSENKSLTNHNGISLVVECDSSEEAEQFYKGLSEEGTVLMELQDTFWGAKYGKVRDKYGFVWDLNYVKD